MPDAADAAARAAAAGFGFGAESADTPVKRLSGGEKARLLLGLITWRGPHLIILDEPTNHLDIGSREALAAALNDYAGAVILITHDAHLAEAVADRLWLVKEGRAAPFDGDIEDYRALILDAARTRDARAPAEAKPSRRQIAAQQRALLAPLKKEADALEARLDELNQIVPRLEGALADPALYQNVGRAAKLQKERAALTAAIAEAEEKWLAAQDAYERALSEV
jgi:ATP-binding cassette subfamily F protein 3